MPAASPEPAPLTAAEVARRLDLSPAVVARLEAHLELLRRWQRRLNLVGASTLRDPWRRHVLDSAQLHALLPPAAKVLVDLGSGAGFPGLVLAILGVPEVHLIEADRRKAAFLREAARVCGCQGVVVHARRIEELAPFAADVVTARALAPLERLLALARPFFGPHTRGLFPKGRGVEAELTAARRRWKMAVRIEPSLSAPEGRILVIEGMAGVEPVA